MEKLTALSCTRPKKGETLTNEEIYDFHTQIPAWKIVEPDGIPSLQRVFRFTNFAEALTFTNRVGELAEAEDHHPAILTEWGRVTVTFWTHVTRGLHRNDFIAAAKTDLLYESAEKS
ncbi:MAG TPA: 4a-hydroxytetrahydrobiopterin dehydratase [Anaerolineales bacterium]|nr:4a-hydroxytetrahydrobiopterin dehydratase [Anaerolineales bacterium]